MRLRIGHLVRVYRDGKDEFGTFVRVVDFISGRIGTALMVRHPEQAEDESDINFQIADRQFERKERAR